MGNKCDLGEERVVDYKDAKAYADKHNFQYFETSAKTKINVDKAFTKLTQTVYATKYVHAARRWLLWGAAPCVVTMRCTALTASAPVRDAVLRSLSALSRPQARLPAEECGRVECAPRVPHIRQCVRLQQRRRGRAAMRVLTPVSRRPHLILPPPPPLS